MRAGADTPFGLGCTAPRRVNTPSAGQTTRRETLHKQRPPLHQQRRPWRPDDGRGDSDTADAAPSAHDSGGHPGTAARPRRRPAPCTEFKPSTRHELRPESQASHGRVTARVADRPLSARRPSADRRETSPVLARTGSTESHGSRAGRGGATGRSPTRPRRAEVRSAAPRAST